MCFYNQRKFACGDFNWTGFAYQCNYEYRTGETCGIKLVNVTEYDTVICRLCEKIETKRRRRSAEIERLTRWEREGGTLVASMDKCKRLIGDLGKEITHLERERDEKQKSIGTRKC